MQGHLNRRILSTGRTSIGQSLVEQPSDDEPDEFDGPTLEDLAVDMKISNTHQQNDEVPDETGIEVSRTSLAFTASVPESISRWLANASNIVYYVQYLVSSKAHP